MKKAGAFFYVGYLPPEDVDMIFVDQNPLLSEKLGNFAIAVVKLRGVYADLLEEGEPVVGE